MKQLTLDRPVYIAALNAEEPSQMIQVSGGTARLLLELGNVLDRAAATAALQLYQEGVKEVGTRDVKRPEKVQAYLDVLCHEPEASAFIVNVLSPFTTELSEERRQALFEEQGLIYMGDTLPDLFGGAALLAGVDHGIPID